VSRETRVPTTHMIHEAINWWGPRLNGLEPGQQKRYGRALRHVAAVATGHPDASLIAQQAADEGWTLHELHQPTIREAATGLWRAVARRVGRLRHIATSSGSETP
jgi:hypothetical protein